MVDDDPLGLWRDCKKDAEVCKIYLCNLACKRTHLPRRRTATLPAASHTFRWGMNLIRVSTMLVVMCTRVFSWVAGALLVRLWHTIDCFDSRKRKRTHVHERRNTDIHAITHTRHRDRTRMHIHTRTQMRTNLHTCTCANSRTYTHTHTCTTYTYSFTRMHTHTDAHSCTHVHIHTHSRMFNGQIHIHTHTCTDIHYIHRDWTTCSPTLWFQRASRSTLNRFLK